MIEALINGVSVFLGALAGGIIVGEYMMWRTKRMIAKEKDVIYRVIGAFKPDIKIPEGTLHE